MTLKKVHNFECRVYYEDTDMAGIVYYANYLKFIERGRSDLMRQLGIDQQRLCRDLGVFSVRKIEANYLKPARLDDLLRVETRVSKMSGVRVYFDQCVYRDDYVLFDALVQVVFVQNNGRPMRLNCELQDALGQFIA